MISRHLSAKLRPFAFAAVAALTGVGAATIGLSPAENAAAAERGSPSIAQVAAESEPVSALSRILTGEFTGEPGR